MPRMSLCGFALAGLLCAASPASAQNAALNDGQILRFVQTVNEGEIGGARLAMKRAKSPDVKSLAKHMLDDHLKSEKVIAETARKAKMKLANSEESLSLKNQVGVGEKELKAAKGADFDKEYAQAQAKMHAEVATTLQSKMMPAATSDAVKSTLAQTLSTVQEHERMAQDVAGKL
jgi:putative membrane protein